MLILALDQGTTGSAALVFDEQARVRGAADRELRQYYPAEGQVEHDPVEIWETTLAVAREALGRAGGPEALAAIGITNQRETTILWERASGRPGPASSGEGRPPAGNPRPRSSGRHARSRARDRW